MKKYSKKIVGETEIVEEEVTKIRTTKNVTTETIRRKTTKALLLECGHTVSLVNYYVAPTSRTKCYDCEWEQEDSKKFNQTN